MGKFVLSNICLWGSFFLLLVSACKPLVRQHVSDISAISDARLTLGVVPIEKDDGRHAYRMLLCKKAEAYPPSMLADERFCRTALHDRSGAEIAFMPNEFKRDFGTKYKGYAKQATILGLAIVPFAILGGRAGAWRHTKKIEALSKGDIDLSELKAGKFSADLINKQFSSNGWEFYSTEWKQLFDNVMKSNSNEQVPADELKRLADSLVGFPESLATAAQLKIAEDSKKLLQELIDLSDEQRAARFTKLDEEIKSFNNGVLHDEDGSFWKEFEGTKERFEQLIKEAQSEDKTVDELRSIMEELEQVGENYHKGILQYHEVEGRMTIREFRQRLVRYAAVNDKIIANNKESLLNFEDGQSMPLRVYEYNKSLEQSTELAQRNRTIGRVGGAGLAAAIMLALDKSIWGYADRQVSKYWNQIFVEHEDFKDISRVKDVRFILQVLADKFGFFVNQRALQLAQ